jgi:hypothetical protein
MPNTTRHCAYVCCTRAEFTGQLHAPAALQQGKEPPVPGHRAGLDAAEKGNCLSPVGNRTPAVQLVARRYTD